MPRRTTARLALGALLAPCLAGVPAATSATSPSALIVAKINRARAANGLAPLRTVSRLSAAARRHSVAQARSGSLTHDGFSARIFGSGIRGLRTAGENVGFVTGCGRRGVAIIFRGWMRSAPHRANILSPRFRLIGTGIALRGSCASLYATAEFAG